jgi:hypothetical protein
MKKMKLEDKIRIQKLKEHLIRSTLRTGIRLGSEHSLTFDLFNQRVNYEDILKSLNYKEVNIDSNKGEMTLYLNPKERDVSFAHYKANEGIKLFLDEELDSETRNLNRHSLYLVADSGKEKNKKIVEGAKELIDIIDKNYSIFSLKSMIIPEKETKTFTPPNITGDLFYHNIGRKLREELIMDSLKKEEKINLESVKYVENISSIEENEIVELSIKPIQPFKNPNSTFKESGTISGSSRLNATGTQGLIIRVPNKFEGTFSGSYQGSGEIDAINGESDIMYLCKDKNNNSLIINNTISDLDVLFSELHRTYETANGCFEVNIKQTEQELREKLFENFGHKNSNKLYMQIFNAEKLNQDVNIIGTIKTIDDVKYFCLNGFKDNETGKKILIRDYKIGSLIDKSKQIVEEIKYKR